MTDAETIASWNTISNLEVAVEIFIDNSPYIGTDPYYRDLNDALWDMLGRALEARKAENNG